MNKYEALKTYFGHTTFRPGQEERICAKKPLSNKEILSVSGVGEAKLARYGSYFLGCIENYLAYDASEG